MKTDSGVGPDHREAYRILAEIDSEVAVDGLRMGDLNLWPLLRLFVWRRLLHGEQRSRVSIPDGLPYSGDRGLAERAINAWRFARSLRGVQRWAPVDVVFYSRAVDHSDRFGERYFNRHIDPLMEEFRNEGRMLKLEMWTSNGAKMLPRFEPVTFIDTRYFVWREPYPVVEGMQILNSSDYNVLSDWPVEALARWLWATRALFRRVLQVLRPKVLFLVCYYDPAEMALIAAARQLGIPTVEIQHGRQGHYHGLYSPWTKIPSNGYEMLPDFFWVWSEKDRRCMLEGRPDENMHHRPIVGGNRWLGRSLKAESVLPGALGNGLGQQGKRASKVLLVTLQPIEDWLPQILLKAMQQAPADWLWLVRPHPHQRGRIPETEAKLREFGVRNFLVRETCDFPLYAWLKFADVHLTCWSSVALEAGMFDVPTVIIHPNGATIFAEEIAAGKLYYVESEENLLHLLPTLKRTASNGDIEVSSERARSAFHEILARTQQR